MEFITKIGDTEIILLLTLCITLIFIYKRDWFNSIFFLTLSLGGFILNFSLKLLFGRERQGELSFIEVFSYSFEIPSYSFPSGHTMRTVILFGFLLYLSSQLIKRMPLRYCIYFICLLIIIGVSLSRIFLEAHYFSDVISAISIALSWFYLLLFIKNIFQEKLFL
ncbi:phosphatase PAP2 family protein [Alteribacillus sp. JSM 102045]|uniref:phosphatase PAP2 family protein n=1 Tax=Alteribacillus sp. JSM 102045 TaxID=1562101 RepID=UPI0035C00625